MKRFSKVLSIILITTMVITSLSFSVLAEEGSSNKEQQNSEKTEDQKQDPKQEEGQQEQQDPKQEEGQQEQQDPKQEEGQQNSEWKDDQQLTAGIDSDTQILGTEDFAGGSGTADSPYEIQTEAQLKLLSSDNNKYYKLTADIELANAWKPIEEFKGVFDGNGYKISNLKFDSSTGSVGMFQTITSTGVVQNLTITGLAYSCDSITANTFYAGGIAAINSGTISNCSIGGELSIKTSGQILGLGGIAGLNNNRVTGCHSDVKMYGYCNYYTYVGGIAGYSVGSLKECDNKGNVEGYGYSYNMACIGGVIGRNDKTVEECHNSGKVTVSGTDGSLYCGGICGYNYRGGTVTRSYNEGVVTSGTIGSYVSINIGGIAGGNLKATVSYCYNTGAVNSYRTDIGGIVGGVYDSGTITKCFNMGKIGIKDNDYRVGGIAGYVESGSKVEYCYNVGELACRSYMGGILGYCNGPITGCYFLDSTCSQYAGYNAAEDLGKGKASSSDMKNSDTYEGFDFDKDWTMAGNEDYDYPELISNPLVYVRPAKNIEVVKGPDKQYYVRGEEELVTDGARLQVNYDDGTFKTIDITSDMVSKFDNSAAGICEVKVEYAGRITSFKVQIVTVKAVTVSKAPVKTLYVVDEPLDVWGGKLMVTYQLENSEEGTGIVDITRDMVKAFNSRDITPIQDPRPVELEYYGLKTHYMMNVVDKDSLTQYAKLQIVHNEGTEKQVNYYFATLEGALEAVENNDIITLLDDIKTDERLLINTGKTFTIDFAKKEYCAGVADPNSGEYIDKCNYALKLAEGQTITMLNGIISVGTENLTQRQDNKNITNLIVNQGNLILSSMYLNCNNMPQGEIAVTTEYGSLDIVGSTTIYREAGNPALEIVNDYRKGANSARVTINTDGSIGDIKIQSIPVANMTAASTVTIKAGNFTIIPGGIRPESGTTVLITGGTFEEAFDAAYCETGYGPVKNDNNKYVVGIAEYQVDVQSRIAGTDLGITNIPGGGMDITYFDGTTLTAPVVTGYKFIGWYAGYSAADNGSCLSTDRTYLYKPAADAIITAVYTAKTNTTYILNVNASKFTVTGIKAVQMSSYRGVFDEAQEITVEYKDSSCTFLYWVNASGKVVSNSAKYTFIIGANTDIHAVYSDNDVTGQALVVFQSNSGHVMQAQACTEEDTIEFPLAPTKTGNDFVKWVFASDKTTEATEAAIRAAIATGNVIRVVPEYRVREGSNYDVTVYYAGTDRETEVLKNNGIGTACKLTAPEIQGKYFQYWQAGANDSDGEILSYNSEYYILALENTNVTAVYADTEIGADVKKATAVVGKVYRSLEGGKYNLKFIETYSLLTGQSLINTGFVVTTDRHEATNTGLVRGGTNVVEFLSSLTENQGSYLFNARVSSSTKVIYARAFVQYKDSDGSIHTVYSGIVSESYGE